MTNPTPFFPEMRQIETCAKFLRQRGYPIDYHYNKTHDKFTVKVGQKIICDVDTRREVANIFKALCDVGV